MKGGNNRGLVVVLQMGEFFLQSVLVMAIDQRNGPSNFSVSSEDGQASCGSSVMPVAAVDRSESQLSDRYSALEFWRA